MPRFYFHLRDDFDADDEEGQELAGLAAAREAAVGQARQIAAEDVRQGCLNLGYSIEIANEEGEVVATVTFEDAVTIEDC